jgi:shikimate dehydrogenase
MSLARAGARSLTLFDLDRRKLEELASDIARLHPRCGIVVAEVVAAAGHDIIINATPVGMAPGDGLPTPLGPLDPACTVFDIVPKPDVTPLMACATKAGCRVGGGRLMIEGQTDAVLDFLGFGP